MTQAITGLIGVLLGATITGLITYVATVRETRERARVRLAEACVELLGALVDHRRHQYLKIAAVREHAPYERLVALRELRYEARSSVSRAMARVQMAGADTDLMNLAHDAVSATFILGDVADEDALDPAGEIDEAELTARRDASLTTHDELLRAAGLAVA
ncbi:hypothetical protein [Streptomyces violascens]|uniref:hypothetical protein n=1 Tax=Streptomyces violascens TaxID=67381 RepID=UPI0036C89B20